MAIAKREQLIKIYEGYTTPIWPNLVNRENRLQYNSVQLQRKCPRFLSFLYNCEA